VSPELLPETPRENRPRSRDIPPWLRSLCDGRKWTDTLEFGDAVSLGIRESSHEFHRRSHPGRQL
jgi:hypothetical protein